MPYTLLRQHRRSALKHLAFFLFYLLLLSAASCKPLTTKYRAFGPLPDTFAEPLDPLSAIHTGLLTTLSTIQTFPSEIADGGFAKWHTTKTNKTTGATHLNFPSINVDLLLTSFGIPGVSFISYVVGTFTVPKSSTYLLTCTTSFAIHPRSNTTNKTLAQPSISCHGTHSLETPCSVSLQKHVQYLILLIVGGVGNNTTFSCGYHPSIKPGRRPKQLLVINDTIVPDVMRVNRTGGNVEEILLAGRWMSVSVMNTHGTEWLRGGRVVSLNQDENGMGRVEVVGGEDGEGIVVQDIPPGGVRGLSIPIVVGDTGLHIEEGRVVKWELEIRYNNEKVVANVNGTMKVVDWIVHDEDDGVERIRLMEGAPHSYRFTFLSRTRDVQYAAVVVPQKPCGLCAIVLGLHGAGVEAGKDAWTGSYKRMDGAWVVLPSGRRPYGFDWHGPMMDNAWKSVDEFADGLMGVPTRLHAKTKTSWWGKKQIIREGLVELDRSRFVFTGHSMGSHSCSVFFTHYPDVALGGVCASGWLRLGNYGGWWLRQSQSFADSRALAMLRGSLEEYSVDLYARNSLSIPFLGRTGDRDETVPPWNVRRMVRVLKQHELWAGIPSNKSVVSLSEVAGKGHWFWTVLNDDKVQSFFDHVISKGKPLLPKRFQVFTINPGTTGSRGGLRILQLGSPIESGILEVARSGLPSGKNEEHKDTKWTITSGNVRRFRFSPVLGIRPLPGALLIDSTNKIEVSSTPVDFCLQSVDLPTRIGDKKLWKKCKPLLGTLTSGRKDSIERGPDTQGPALQVLSNRPVRIVYPAKSQGALGRAITLANNLFYRGRYSATLAEDSPENVGKIIDELHHGMEDARNLIILGGSNMNRAARALEEYGYMADVRFPTEKSFCVSLRCFAEPGFGIAYLAGLPSKALAFVCAGTDEEGLSSALSLLPTSSQKEVPEWTVISKKKGWDFKGAGGIVGMGYWDRNWKADIRATYPSDFIGFGSVCSGGSSWRFRKGEYAGQIFGMNLWWIVLLGILLSVLLVTNLCRVLPLRKVKHAASFLGIKNRGFAGENADLNGAEESEGLLIAEKESNKQEYEGD
eukprot:Plantae.Rhodophyta-Hildenbrandia_rubra.ctg11855.p1 GENE.Plantae.Rhodophyta-Hildenbrandia_rubra.ctg11855~~Plantae.Rhodophyta-Hildenbrandia_rubra.ctg11855.p1  ORF type:complete len:1080 (+),score=156.17 Plantae.Rhodophyta-Hildenbrandia_rubra.ctg11855:192-3431(+)